MLRSLQQDAPPGTDLAACTAAYLALQVCVGEQYCGAFYAPPTLCPGQVAAVDQACLGKPPGWSCSSP